MKPVNTEFSRRTFLVGSSCALVAGCSSSISNPFVNRGGREFAAEPFSSAYAALPNEQFPIPAVPRSALKPKFRRRRVRYQTSEKPGTVVVDTRNFYLYHVEEDGRAMRYGVGLGRAGFEWSGRARVAWKRKWPTWTPPEEMIQRQPELRKWSAANGGMKPGLLNPLGSRALYIFQGNVDTLYRLHGTPEHHSIGKAVSSGCVRLVNQDVIHLYDRVKSGSSIVVT
ncbi:MAG: L,D-transpeptidase [Pseudomonadota bacterium]